ncbi:hypothetical protein CLV47_114100 [Antricoccus suffuscus]|uniref:Uncharacterized protein n=1 Tax=Antricoccus suffuscus TaxID=1629062 RepID=A0A2T0ZWU0_9ACTN|nr:hypothetical protein [Antricoccus suffuscus]PRZ40803.1 hypothetical protein CLV47_114100 [Antricoccus suffuscus]
MTYPPGNPQQNRYGGPPSRDHLAPGYPAPGRPTYPQGPPPQSYPPPPQRSGPPVSGPGGTIQLDCSYNKLGFFLAFTGPHIRVDGYGQDGTWGRTAIALPPGTHSIEVHTRYLGQMGPAHMLVNVYPGQQIPVFYRAPTAIFFKGAMGHQPQPTPGMWLTWVMFAIAVLVVATAFLF